MELSSVGEVTGVRLLLVTDFAEHDTWTDGVGVGLGFTARELIRSSLRLGICGKQQFCFFSSV